jgi:hypothetical protein
MGKQAIYTYYVACSQEVLLPFLLIQYDYISSPSHSHPFPRALVERILCSFKQGENVGCTGSILRIPSECVRGEQNQKV